MKKKALVWVLCIVMTAMLSIVYGAEIKAANENNQKIFSDVSDDAWYAQSVGQVYELGLMKGTGNGLFSPESTVSVSEIITMAARLNAQYRGITLESQLPSGSFDTWYAPYVEYALANGIIEEGQFENYEQPAKRFEIAQIFASSLPDDYFAVINTVGTIPDVSASDPYYEEVLKMYKSGIMMGSDDYGTFYPNDNLTRAEASAVITRIVIPEQRLKKTLQSKTSNEAYFLIDSPNTASGRNGLANAWLYDNKNQLFNVSGRDTNVIFDTSTENYSALYRDFDEESDGKLTLEMYASVNSADDGVYVGFAGDDGDCDFSLKTDSGFLTLSGTSDLKTGISVNADEPAEYAIILYIDLDANLMTAKINNVMCGSVSIPDVPVSRLIIGSTKEGTGRIEPHQIRLTKNYALFEHFAATDALEGSVPCDMDIAGDVKISKILSNTGFDVFSAKIDASAGSSNSAYKEFDQVYGEGVFETYILLPEKRDGAYFALYSGDTEVLRVETKNGAWYCGETFLRDYTRNIWQTVRIDTHPADGKATVKICGKAVAEIDCTAEYVDGIKIGFDCTQDGVMWFDDIKAHAYVKADDYPSEPVPAVSEDYNIGIHVCNLWRDSNSGEGWDSSAPFDELEPYLGFYDEGNPELADWEIKMMVEHGIDFQHMCWYAPFNQITAPIKIEKVSGAALHDGYMNALYSDMMTFCIMWENNGVNASNFDQFKEYLWNYWKEYYFSDPRYTVLDNSPVLTVWSYGNFVSCFGGEEQAKQAIAFMREDIKSLGYDNIILLFADGHQMTKDFFDKVQALGFDGTYPYHFNQTGKDAEHQIYRMSTQISFNSVHTIPAVSVGFNDIGRNEKRSELITPEGHLQVCEYIRDEALPARSTGTWKDNTFFVSTWNEYSEGTYVCPSNIYGYAYLENIRKVFTNDTSDHSEIDVIPTEQQKARITHMYPDNHQPIRWYQFEKSDVVKEDMAIDALVPVKTWDFSTAGAKTDWKHMFGILDYDDSGDVIKGHSDSFDYAITNTADLNIPIDDVPYLHLRLKTSSAASFQIFYITEDDTTWDENKYVTKNITKSGEFVDYYVDMTETFKWRGTLKRLRIDPLTVAGSFEIELIELMSIDETYTPENTKPTFKVNTKAVELNFMPVMIGEDEMEVTGDPRKGFFSQLGLFHVWDRFTGTLMVENNSHKVVFTVGSSTAICDGTPVDLGYEFRLRDGLPVFRVGKLCELLGYKLHIDGNTFDVQCATDEEYEAIKNQKEYEWNFEIDGYAEGFSAQNGLITVKDGIISLNATNADPALISAKFELKASTYTKLKVGIIADKENMDGQWMQLFFTKSSSGSMSEDKSYKVYYDTAQMTDGEIYEVTFNLEDCPLWSNYITQIRIDPFNRKETAQIAYIRFAE